MKNKTKELIIESLTFALVILAGWGMIILISITG